MKHQNIFLFLALPFIIFLFITLVASSSLQAQTFVFSQTISGKEVISSANYDFSSIKKLTNSDTSCWDPAISPDGKYIAYFKGNYGDAMDLWVMDSEGKNAKRLTYDVINYGSHPSWHPDGKQILYESASGTDVFESSIRIVNMSGTNDSLFFNNAGDKDRFPCMNPANTNNLVYHYDPGNWPYFSQIRIQDLTANKDVILVDNNGWADGPFALSPDGKMLLWSEIENGDEMRLRTINLTTKSISTISTVKGENCLVTGKFDPTGNYIFYLRRSGTEMTEIMRCKSDGSYPAVLYTGNNINSLNVIPDETVALYTFNSNAKDIFYGNDGTVHNYPVPQPDRLGHSYSAYLFNGYNSYISVPHNSSFNFGTGDFSVFTFVRLDAIPSDWADIVSKHNTTASYNNEFFIRIAGITGKPFFGLTSSEGSIELVNGDSSLYNSYSSINGFHSICGVRENGQIKLYVDKVLVDSAKSTINPDNTNPLNIGRSSYNNGYGYFNGIIDDVRIYSRALSSKEITSLHMEGTPNPEAAVTCFCDTCDYAVEWISPLESPLCGFTEPQPVKIRITNHGNKSANCVSVSYSINNDSSRIYDRIETVILPDSSLEYTFKQTADMSAVKTYYCSVKVSFLGYDANFDDNISRIRIYNNRRKILIETAESQCNQATGMAIISGVINVVPPYTVSWSDGQTTTLADNLASGIYQVTVTDSEGCSDTKSATIDEIGGPWITFSYITDNPCYGMNEGAIDITVFGIAPPYSYEWSNGAVTEDINGLAAGTYHVNVTDKAGCKKNGSFKILEPAPLNLTISTTNSAVITTNGSAQVKVSGGTSPYEYYWQETGTTESLETGLGSGTYHAVITDANGCKDSIQSTIFKLCGPDIMVNSVIPSECGLNNGMIDINIPEETGSLVYQWSNGDTIQDLINAPSGYYKLTVKYKDSECASVAELNVPALLDPVPICMVSVDIISNRNMIVWQKPFSYSNISAFNIYRETDPEKGYQLIGTSSILEESVFIDTDNNADPSVQSWKYKLSVVDTCGNESELYGVHKTIHLEATKHDNTVELSWDNYSGFDYYTCYIYRYSEQYGLQKLFDKDASTQVVFNSFIDLTPPETGDYYYYIEIESPYTCTSEKKATSHNSVRSNKTNKISIGIFPELHRNIRNIVLYPNPNNGTFTLSLELDKADNIIYKIYDSYGRLIYFREAENITDRFTEEINFTDKSPGIYHLQIIMNDGVITKPFVVE
jgi:Tol biopolymer transport system component